jgi:hypothetical protein
LHGRRTVRRDAWRTCRVDRVTDAVPTATAATSLAVSPDAPELISQMLLADYPLYTTVRLAPIDEARQIVPAHRGHHQYERPDTTVAAIGGTEPDQLAAYLISLTTPLRVRSPDSVRHALSTRSQQLIDINRG